MCVIEAHPSLLCGCKGSSLCTYCSWELVSLLVWWFLLFLHPHTQPPSLCYCSSIDKCAPSFTVTSRCFDNREHAQTILCPRITHCFLWRVGLFFYFVHISMTPRTRALWCQPFFFPSVFLVVHSWSWRLIKLSWSSNFYSIPFFMSWEVCFFLSAHTGCTVKSPKQVNQRPWRPGSSVKCWMSAVPLWARHFFWKWQATRSHSKVTKPILCFSFYIYENKKKALHVRVLCDRQKEEKVWL